MSGEISVARLEPGDEAAWQEFLDRSLTGTLFHDLRFLAYHPPGRHDFHHLIFRQEGRIVALLPGGLLQSPEGIVFASPVGASVGGFVLDADCRLDLALRLVESLIAHAKSAGWRGLDVTLPPPIYNGRLAALPSFALSRSGFVLANRHACFVQKLSAGRTDGFAAYFRATSANLVRAARRKGAIVLRDTLPAIDLFLPLFDDTYQRHGAAPTHSHDDLRFLAARFPDRLVFYVAQQDGEPTGGICVFRLNPRAATAFYICSSTARAHDNGTLVVMAAAMDDLAASGTGYFDLGPSADYRRVNEGVVRFKEGLGTEYHLRERWTSSW